MFTHVMPISFMGGTGGNFIRSLLISAKVGYTNLWDMSSHGNSHWGPMEIYNDTFNKVPNDLSCQVADVINAIERSSLTYDPKDCFYQNMHIIDLPELMKYFSKSIRVTYNFEDVIDVSMAMVAKNGDDGKVDLNDIYHIKKNYIGRKMIMIKHLRDFQPIEDLKDRVLFISWQELLNKDGHKLFADLSNFTGIPEYSFSHDNLALWRTKTNKTVQSFKQRLGHFFR